MHTHASGNERAGSVALRDLQGRDLAISRARRVSQSEGHRFHGITGSEVILHLNCEHELLLPKELGSIHALAICDDL